MWAGLGVGPRDYFYRPDQRQGGPPGCEGEIELVGGAQPFHWQGLWAQAPAARGMKGRRKS